MERKFRVSYETCIQRCIETHGNEYIYYRPKEYTGTDQRIKIKCKKCGNVFEQSLRVHYGGSGCPVCGLRKIGEKSKGKSNQSAKRLIYGCAFCDSQNTIRGVYCYKVWRGVLDRCFDVKFQEKEPSYKGCSVCNEWLLYSNFEKWFNQHYVEGFEIDKDLLSNKNKKLYSPETCVFLPREINRFLCKTTNKKDQLPLGVYVSGGSIIAKHRKRYLGAFQTIEEANTAYLKAKKEYVIELANKWKDKIESRAYDALINLDVDNFFK